MLIREPRHDELEFMAETHGRAFHAISPYREIPFDVGSMIISFIAMMDQGLCLVSDVDGVVVGGIGGMAAPLFFNNAVTCGYEQFWWMDEAYRGGRMALLLLDRIEKAARERGCAGWVMLALEGGNGAQLASLYTRRGYVRCESGFLKRFGVQDGHFRSNTDGQRL